MKKIIFTAAFLFFYICNGAFADAWIQYDIVTGVQRATNSQKVSDTVLADNGAAQILYTGKGDPTTMMVDVTQNPPAIIPAPPPPAPPASELDLMFAAMVKDGKIDPATIAPADLDRINASLAVSGVTSIPVPATALVATPAR